MAGEMFKSELTKESYPLYFAIAKALKGTVEPFDQYQGHYVLIGKDIRLGREPYALAPRGLGIVRLWIVPDEHWPDYEARVYNEATDKLSEAFPLYCKDAEELAVYAAREVMG